MLTLLVFYLGSSFLLAMLSIPIIFEKIKPNPLYGFRVSQTLENPRLWYATNKHFGKRLLAVAIFEALGSVGLYWVPGISIDAYAIGCLLVFMLVFPLALVQSWLYLKSIS